MDRRMMIAPINSDHKFDVLILEDERDLAEMLGDQLQSVYHNCKVTIASEADEVVNEVAKIANQDRHFYLVITDYTVLKRIKQNVSVEQSLVGILQVSNPRPPVFLMSSAGFETILKEYPDLKQYINAYLQKPVNMDSFLG